jgi:hypothetical protein
MKKFLLLAAVFATGFTAMAQQKADEVIKVNTEKYDFGKIKQNIPVTTYFVITNTSNKPIAIENAWAGCGCTTPEYSKEPIAPNATAKLKVGYNAAAMGTFEKPVYVKIAGYQDPKVINITGEVVPTDAAAGVTPSSAKTSSASIPAMPATSAVKKDAGKKAKKVKTS